MLTKRDVRERIRRIEPLVAGAIKQYDFPAELAIVDYADKVGGAGVPPVQTIYLQVSFHRRLDMPVVDQFVRGLALGDEYQVAKLTALPQAIGLHIRCAE